MTAHELAYRLLTAPNIDVLVHTINGLELVESIVTEDEKYLWHFQEQVGTEDLDFDDDIHKVFEEQNDEPSIILISESSGIG